MTLFVDTSAWSLALRRDAAAEIRNTCRRAGIQVGTIDALLARLCLRHDLTLLTTDNDFKHAARLYPLRIWSARG